MRDSYKAEGENRDICLYIQTNIHTVFFNDVICTLFWIPNITVNYCNYVVYFVMVLISTIRVNNYRKKTKYFNFNILYCDIGNVLINNF